MSAREKLIRSSISSRRNPFCTRSIFQATLPQTSKPLQKYKIKKRCCWTQRQRDPCGKVEAELAEMDDEEAAEFVAYGLTSGLRSLFAKATGAQADRLYRRKTMPRVDSSSELGARRPAVQFTLISKHFIRAETIHRDTRWQPDRKL